MDGDPAGEERAAEHLLATEPAGDPWIVRRLAEARPHRGARGAPESAAVLLRRRWPSRRPRPSGAGLLLELGVAEATAGQAAGEDHLPRRSPSPATTPRRRSARRSVLAHALGRAERLADAVAVIDRPRRGCAPGDEQTSELLETLA